MINDIVYYAFHYNPVSLGVKFISNSLDNYYKCTPREYRITTLAGVFFSSFLACSIKSNREFWFGTADYPVVKAIIIMTIFCHSLGVFAIGAFVEVTKPFFRELIVV